MKKTLAAIIRLSNFAFLILSISWLAGAPVAFGQTYSLTDLGDLGGGRSCPADINSSGQVTGYSWTSIGAQNAFLYSGGTMRDIGTSHSLSQSQGYAINDNGQVVGYYYLNGYDAFLYNGTTMQDLGTLGGSTSVASGINGGGQIVGYAQTASGATHAFLYSAGKMTDLGTLGGSYSSAYAINNSGQVVGMAYTTTGSLHAFLYSAGVMQDIGQFDAVLINNSGQIAGYDYYTGKAYLYFGGQLQDLGNLGISIDRPFGINNLGQVVGSSYTQSGDQHAFLYSDGVMQDLNNLVQGIPNGCTLAVAEGINDSGQIVAYGPVMSGNTGVDRAFLLTPIPEPGVFALLLLGIATVLFRRRGALPRQ